MKNVLIRADSSSSIGLGHIMRDLVLAKQFPSKNVIFATQNLEGNINHKITEAGYKLKTLQTNDLEELDSLIKKLNIDLLIIDNYNINYAYEKQLKTQNSKLKIMVLDDTYEKHHCDILLNQNLGANEEKYKTLVPKNCELRCGEKHTLIREEFHQAKSSTTYPLSPTPYHLFISFGGSDPTSTTIKVLESLKAFKNIKANVVTTTANKNLDQLKSFAKDNLWVDLHINSNNIANIMATSNLAIVTPSVILNEVYFMQLPFIAIKTMNNQKEIYDFLKQNDFLALEQFDEKKLQTYINDAISKHISLVNFTNLTFEEKKLVLSWRNHPDITKWMYNQKEISQKEHLDYIKTLEDRKDKLYFLVKQANEYIGVIDFTNINSTKQSAHIGLYANPNTKGVGNTLMETICKYRFKHLTAEAFADNKKAISLYKKFGFRQFDTKMVNDKMVICMNKIVGNK